MVAMRTIGVASRPPVARPLAAPLVAGGILLGGCVTLALVDPAGGPPICPFKAVTGFDCPGCGGTRAVHQLLNGHLGAALDFNVLAVLALPLILWGAFVTLTLMLRGPKLRMPSLSSRWTWVALVVVALFWVVRNLPVAPFDWLGTGT